MATSQHLYLIGIGGVGMVWIADWALAQGWSVSGSDITSTVATQRLQAAGAHISYDSTIELPSDVTEVIITSAITPSSPSFPQLQEAQRRGLPVSKRALYIGKITRQKRTLAVAGTHGKTTTTAMLGWILQRANLHPTVFVGGALKEWEGKTLIGDGDFLVLEADEFDRSFHNFNAEAAILLNIDADHLDYYAGGIEEIRHSFRRFLRNLPHVTGLVVGYGKDKNIRQVAKGFKYRFRWYDEQHMWPGLKLQIPGIHNLLNATAAARLAHEIGVDQQIILAALADFPGVGRRFEYVGKWNQAQVYDDYGHHPKEIAATLQGFVSKYPSERKILIFQPHQKARTQLLLKDFGRAFDANSVDELILAPIYQVAGREEDIAISSEDIATEIAKKSPAGMKVTVASTAKELGYYAQQAVEQPGVLLVMGAGSIRRELDGWMAT